METIFDKIVYGVKVVNDNLILLNEKVDRLLAQLNTPEELTTCRNHEND